MTIIEIKIGYDPSDGKWVAWTEYAGATGPNDAAATMCSRNTCQEAITALLQAGTVEAVIEDRKKEADAAYALRNENMDSGNDSAEYPDANGNTG